jgi:hypothetical protein
MGGGPPSFFCFEDIDAELSSKQNIISGGVTIAF